MNIYYKQILVIPTLAILGVLQASATIRLPRLVSDGMVLQRNQPLKIWGWASPREAVTIKFLKKSYHINSDDSGHWLITLSPCGAGGPYQMTISGTNSITIRDILVGDVWLCSGQSNMEFTMSRVTDKYATEIAGSDNSHIRQFMVGRNPVFHPAIDVKSDGWLAASPKTVLNFTAVGYFFAKALYEKNHVPIGLINSTYGGTPAQAWTSAAGLKDFPGYTQIADWYQDSSRIIAKMTRDKAYVDAWYQNASAKDKGLADPDHSWISTDATDDDWATIDMPAYWGSQWLKGESGVVYFRRTINIPPGFAGKDAQLFLGKIREQDSTYFNGVKVGSNTSGYTPRIYTIPARLIKPGRNVIAVRALSTVAMGGFDPYNHNPYQLVMGNTVIPLTGTWKYKVGASVDYLRADSITQFNKQPTQLFNGMIAPLIPFALKGVIWYQGEDNASKAREYRTLFPALIKDWRAQWRQRHFPFLFVQLANYQAPSTVPSEGGFADLREAQLMTLALPETGMAVIHDIGDGKDIHPLNKKDVGLRLALIAENQVYKDKSIIYTAPVFHFAKFNGNKVIIYFRHTESGLISNDGKPLRYFAIAGPDRKFVWAKAGIEGNHIIVSSNAVPIPAAVRYAWANNPEGANLFNKTGLPVSSFRTDDWVLQPKKN